VTPEINAISSLMIGFVTIGVLAASYVSKQQSIRVEQERRRAIGAAG